MMATKPSRSQQRACDYLAEALDLITEAARLDGKGTLSRNLLDELARLAAQATLAFTLDEIIARALERRARALDLSSSTGELLMLIEADVTPARDAPLE